MHGCAALSALATFVGRTFVPLPLVERWMLRCLRWSSLCLSAGAAYLQLWFGDECCCAVCAAARYDVGRSCVHLASVSKMDVSAQSALQLAMFETLRLSAHFAWQCFETLRLSAHFASQCLETLRLSARFASQCCIYWHIFKCIYFNIHLYSWVYVHLYMFIRQIYIFVYLNIHIFIFLYFHILIYIEIKSAHHDN